MEEGSFTFQSSSLPGAILYPTTAVLCLVMAAVILKTRSNAARFVIFACTFRYIFNAYHQFSYSPSPAGISWNAVATILICLLGLAVLDIRRILTPFYLPIGAILVLITLSGIANSEYAGVFATAPKFGYLAVVCAGVAQASRDIGTGRFLKLLLWSFAAPLLLQFFSIVMGISKASEADGSASYIGGYNHEAVFSVTLATCLLVTVLCERLSAPRKSFLVIASVTGIFLANYRTAILAMAPLILVQVAAGVPLQFKRNQRALVFVAVGMVLVVAFAMAVLLASERFNDLTYVWNNLGHIIKPVQDFSPAERKLLSGRLYLWSDYFYGYWGGSDLQHLIGFGPDAWQQRYTKYAHNTLVSYLYEYGALGVFAILFLWGWMFSFALKVRGSDRAKLIAAHVSFFVLNMATMPHWQIEGNILYGILCGYTLARVRQRPMRFQPKPEQMSVEREEPRYGRPPLRPAG